MKLDTKTALGIDISNGRINLALLRKNKNGLELVKTATGPIPDGAIKNGNIEDPAVLAKGIKQLKSHSKMRVRLRQAAVSLVARPTIMQIIEMPKQAPTGVRQFCETEMKHCVALSGKKIALDFCGIGAAKPQSSNRVFVVATDSEKITQLVKACRLAGVNLEAIEPPLVAYIRTFYANKIAGRFDRNVLIAVLANSDLALCVFRKQTLDFVRTRQSNKDKVDPSELCEWVASEVNTVIAFYDVEVMESPGRWEVFVIVDDEQVHYGALESLKDEIACDSLQVKTPEDAYQDMPIKPSKSATATGASVVAIGLAMKPLAGSYGNLRVNLLPPEAAEVKSLKKHAIITGNIIAAVLLVMVLAIGALSLKIEKVKENIVRKKQQQSLQNISELLKEEKLLDRQIKQLSEGPGQLNEIISLRRGGDWLGFLNDLKSKTPEMVRITNLTSSGGSRMLLEGLALSYESVRLFVNMLGKSEYLDSASLIEAEKDEQKDGLVRYAIDCSLTPEEGKITSGVR